MGILETVGSILPVVGTVLGGPLGGAAAGGISFLLKQMGASDDIVEAAKNIAADPQKLAEFNLKARELEVEQYKAQLADVQDSRHMLTQLTMAGSKTALVPGFLSFLITGGTFTCMFASIWIVAYQGTITPEQREMLQMVINTLTVPFGMVLSFWFGSSKGSENKDAALKSLAIGSK